MPACFNLAIVMREKICWTVYGRKKRVLVDDNNKLIKELEDLGPLSEIEMKWVKSNCGMPYKEWLETQEKEEEEGDEGEEEGEEEEKVDEEEVGEETANPEEEK